MNTLTALRPNSFTAIRGLFFHRGPTTILGRVVAVIVDALKREFRAFPDTSRRSQSHVSQEVLKFSPANANTDSASAIAFIAAVTRIGAPAFHGFPRFVFWCGTAIFPVAVCDIQSSASGQYFKQKASTDLLLPERSEYPETTCMFPHAQRQFQHQLPCLFL